MGLFLSAKLRRAAATSKLEAQRTKLEQEYKEFIAVQESQELKDYLELEHYIKSENFKIKKKEIESRKYKGSAAWEKEKAYRQLKKSKKIQIYLQLENSSELKAYEVMKNSDEIGRYFKLLQLVKSSGFNKKELSQEWNEFQELKNSSRLQEFLKFRESKKLQMFLKVEGSPELEKFKELEAYVSSDEFKEEKEFLMDKKRFQRTEDFQKLKQYQELKVSASFQKYFKLKEKNSFGELKKWQLTFSDDFDQPELDRKKWITRYYWGDVLLQDSYALPHENHFFTDGENIKISDSVARLETRQEKVKGKVWDPSMGFNFKDFEYTSALISSGKSFRQKYGKFEAKIKVSKAESVCHSFWMLSDRVLPHVDVLKTSTPKKILPGSLWGENENPKMSVSKIKGIDFTKDYFIYTLEWSAEKLVWKINNVVVKEQKEGVPQEPMYVIFSSGLNNSKVNGHLPACMEIDWVKCYQKVE
jgi:beta-glucanase (GH16 family)